MKGYHWKYIIVVGAKTAIKNYSENTIEQDAVKDR